MARELALDVVEQIFILLEVEDLISFKSVCKSWQSLISSPRFVKAHLKLAYANDRNNPELGHRRIYYSYVDQNNPFIVGSCDGLLCVFHKEVEFVVVTNPLTRERKTLPTPPYCSYDMCAPSYLRDVVCWGFGYDSSTDDYKVITGFEKKEKSEWTMLFRALTLKSNTWKVIGQVKYAMRLGDARGILCGGALHWLLTDHITKRVIVSLDLSTEEFREISLPHPDWLYGCGNHDYTLGVIEERLCIYSCCRYLSCYGLPTKKWVTKNNKWEPYIGDQYCQSKYDIAHCLTSTMSGDYICDDGARVPCDGDYVRASIFVKSLVSPHPHVKQQGHEGNERVGANGNLGKRKRNTARKGVLQA